MNVLDLKNHVNFRKGRRGQGLLPRKEREEIRSKCLFCGIMFIKVLYLKNYFSHFFLWKHVDECLRLEDSFESQSATRARLLFCGNMFMNV